MIQQLREWVADKEQNGIKQHSQEWHLARVDTIGGSSLATIQGKNPYSNIQRLLGEKIGMYEFNGDIKPQWGNLFEDVIKRYVEIDKCCEILGEDLFVMGPTGTSYSPDGLAVMDIKHDEEFEEETLEDTPNGLMRRVHMVNIGVKRREIVLVEFKCPFSRIPSGYTPDYYMPQVKMGLEILELPTSGLFIEGVFRKCTWEQLGDNPLFDRKLHPRSSGKLPLAYGIIGFYYNEVEYEKLKNKSKVAAKLELQKNKLTAAYIDHYVEFGDSESDYMCNDLGDSTVELFTMIMGAYDSKMITPWYGTIQYVDKNALTNNGKFSQDETADKMASLNMTHITYNDNEGSNVMNADMDKFTEFCRAHNYKNVGILPWKLFRLDYDTVQKTPDYMEPWMPQIQELMNVVKQCVDPANISIKTNIYNTYINKKLNVGFSDDY